MARNTLTRSARQLADPLMKKYRSQKQVEVADRMDCDPSTLCRLTGENGEKLTNALNFIAANGFGLVDKSTHIAVERKEFELLLLALNGLDSRLREKYLGDE
ncbi:hypothetical protein [Lonepinella sp. BR2474]|uniref:hypothetical protein n=1 Tax=Lonepinella sp. BR2474 TaxID=3434548 RepID=UPI003F6DA5A6